MARKSRAEIQKVYHEEKVRGESESLHRRGKREEKIGLCSGFQA